MALNNVTYGNVKNHALSLASTNSPAPVPADDMKDIIPHEKFEIFQASLLEHEFGHEQAFVSASLQRLQHGIYKDPDLELASTASTDVTLVAVNFILQPSHATMHRFKRLQITLQAFSTDQIDYNDKPHSEGPRNKALKLLRIVKFAPHIVSGRVSTESLHWNFALVKCATVGVTVPLTASINPQTTFDKTKVVNAMMKIQGSTRSSMSPVAADDRAIVQSSKLVWSFEENKSQRSGLPREFTFVFHVEQSVAEAPLKLRIGIVPVISCDPANFVKRHCTQSHAEVWNVSQWLDKEVGQAFPQGFNFATIERFEDLVELPGKSVNIKDSKAEPAPSAPAGL
ncbi:hypothetical protein BP5796_08676 [Coleophoma crateriformis]|uniref:Uncharacterized protein n=1 Tax=Coleophoma crateriformis TaxID=565419 RepID=A0A3D8R8A6_9HELO|nr:hypothetical protein BP5796_08676 [Coleophoma crateriformis]